MPPRLVTEDMLSQGDAVRCLGWKRLREQRQARLEDEEAGLAKPAVKSQAPEMSLGQTWDCVLGQEHQGVASPDRHPPLSQGRSSVMWIPALSGSTPGVSLISLGRTFQE